MRTTQHQRQPNYILYYTHIQRHIYVYDWQRAKWRSFLAGARENLRTRLRKYDHADISEDSKRQKGIVLIFLSFILFSKSETTSLE